MQLKSTGFSLLEILISLSCGLIIAGTAIGLFISNLNTNLQTLKITRLNQDLQTIMQYLVRDIRRIGQIDESSLTLLIHSGQWNPFISSDNGKTLLFRLEKLNQSAPSYDCLLFSNDQNRNGKLDNDELFGYQRYYNSSSKSYSIKMSTRTNSCSGSNWQSFSDEKTININQLSFQPIANRLGNDHKIILCQIQITLSGQLIQDPSISSQISQLVQIANPIYDPNGTSKICQ